MAKVKDYKNFDVTFTENKKYNPATRTVQVYAKDELHARYLVSDEFDTFTFNKELMIQAPTGKRIKIVEVKESKKEKISA